ncbi:hypothetical protein GDO86_003240 [Hymenochirus boettgeri]|uniref:PAK4-inhibitor INKA2 n=1 Tax=Hymenochirus boettgeri TaxID=247094 RepID=A0A8T2K051_9PIPI|nr:hypothetical protein GDO86_003240 [Hymenochirus boettgeri]
MDQYIRRLKQELVSMKEVGEGLQEQMDSMMGALQELKLLQVQSALEQLDLSEEHNQISGRVQNRCCQNEVFEVRDWSRLQPKNGIAGGISLDNSTVASSQGYCTAGSIHPSYMPSTGKTCNLKSVQRGEAELRNPSLFLSSLDSGPINENHSTSKPGRRQLPIDFSDPEICANDHVIDETKDWTSSLMSQSRNRQPLILGDNFFADLVGNWLDLPELEKKGEKSGSHLNRCKSQEIYKKLSFTANFFKKFLRTVRPDRDKLLKERPGWLHAEEQEAEISKRAKKGSKQKGVFYFPSQPDMKIRHGRVEKDLKKVGGKTKAMSSIRIEKHHEEHLSGGFDMNTAVWV